MISEHLVREFVANLTRPDRNVHSTPSGSHDRIVWRCRQGHEWQTVARQRVKYRTQCPVCLAGLWSSRLEHQVAELVQLATGLEVVVGARRPRFDRSAVENVDLLIAGADLLCDLDPTRWHGDDDSVRRDLRKLERFAGERYVRVRPPVLGLLPASRAAAGQQVLLTSDTEEDPWLWATAVIEALQRFWPQVRLDVPDAEARAAALVRGDLRWRRLRSGSRERSLLSEHPSIAAQLVQVVDRPELTAAEVAPSGDDRALWRCPDCGHEWEARIANRTVLGTGCPPCSYRRGATKGARPAPGRSFGDLHPDLVRHFVEDQTNPGLGPYDLKPNSIDRCRWTCPHCGRPWTATPQTLHNKPRAGCREGGPSRSAEGRRGRPRPPDPGESFADRNPGLVDQFLENITHPGVGLDQLRPSSRAMCLWRCPHCGRPWQARATARTSNPTAGCRPCALARRRTSSNARRR